MNKEELIANHLNGVLSNEERLQFEHYLETDIDFKNDVNFQKSVKQAVKKKENHRLKQHLQEIEGQISIKKDKKIRWSIAASIILLVSFGYYFFGISASNEALYDEYFKPAKNIVHPIVRGNNLEDNETKAFIAYKKQDYKMAQQLLHSTFRLTQKSELLFYEGISMMELNNFEQAILILEEHKNYKDAVSDKTNWYLALAYLKKGDKSNAKAILEKICYDTNAFNYNEAKDLLKKL